MKFSASFLLMLVFAGGISHGQLPVVLKPTGAMGICSVETWKANWPGCEFEDGVSEGRLSIAEAGGERWWRVSFAPGGIGPDKGGVGWRWPFSEAPRKRAELRYDLAFEPGFEFVKGGKLPGLCGGPKTITGGDQCTGFDGWSARLMWRRDGRGEAYVYHPHMTGKYGDQFAFPEDFRFPIGKPISVRMLVIMNSAGRKDGALRVWITLPGGGDRLVVEQAAMEWTKTERIGVDSVLFNVFHGGNDASWAPAGSCSLRIGKLGYTVDSQ